MQNIREMKRLYTFKEVYELNSFSKAAKVMFITQAAVSIQIQQLEEELGAEFFIRSGRNSIIATEAGHLLYKQVIKMMDEWQNTMSLLNEISHQKNRCTIGCSHSFSNTYLPKLILELMKEYPNVEFKFQVDNSQIVYDGVQKRTIDFGVIERPLPITESIHRTELIDDDLVLAGDPKGNNWIIREEDSGVRYYNKMFLDEAGLTPETLVTINDNEVILKVLQEGWGTSLVSKQNARSYTFPIQELSKKYMRSFYLIRPVKEDFTSKISMFVVHYMKSIHKN